MASSPVSTSSINSTGSSSSNSSVTVVAATLKPERRSLVPARWEESVRVVGMSECREAALSLAHAFAADDYAQYLVDVDADGGGGGDMHGHHRLSAEEKWKLHVDILTYTVASTCMSGLVTTVGPEYDCVALWYVVPERESTNKKSKES